jgi:hypothetical protein
MKGYFDVFFENPFWVGMITIEDNDKIYAAKWIFGSEPNESEIYNFVLNDYNKLNFIESLNQNNRQEYKKNLKRIQREIRKQQEYGRNLKKSYDIIKKQYENNKLEKKKNKTKKKYEELQKKFNLKQEKKKQKHRGH